MNKFETGINPDETKIEGINPDPQETKIESENILSLEELAKEYDKKVEDNNGHAGIFVEKEKEAIELEKERLIKDAGSFEELFSVLDRIQKLNQINFHLGSIAGKKKEGEMLKIYDIGELKEIIDKTRAGEYKTESGELDTSYITRTAGLRDKVIELLANE